MKLTVFPANYRSGFITNTPPPPTLMATIDSSQQATLRVDTAVTVMYDGVDVTSDAGTTYIMDFKLNGLTLFRAHYDGATGIGGATFDTWHASINSTVQALISSCWTNGAASLHLRDFNYGGNAGLFSHLIAAGLVTYAGWSKSATDFGYTRTIEVTATVDGQTSNTGTVTVPNIYAPVRYNHKQGTSATISYTWDGRMYYDLGDGTTGYITGAMPTFNIGTGSTTYTFTLWGLCNFSTISLTSANGGARVNGAVDLSNLIPVSASVTFGGTAGTEFTFAAGSFASMNFNTNSTLTNISLATGTTIAANTTITATGCPSFSATNVGAFYLRLNEASIGITGATGSINTGGTTPNPSGGYSNANVVAIVARGYTVTV